MIPQEADQTRIEYGFPVAIQRCVRKFPRIIIGSNQRIGQSNIRSCCHDYLTHPIWHGGREEEGVGGGVGKCPR